MIKHICFVLNCIFLPGKHQYFILVFKTSNVYTITHTYTYTELLCDTFLFHIWQTELYIWLRKVTV